MKRSVSFAEYEDFLQPETVAQFLATERWTKHSEISSSETWVLTTKSGSIREAVHLPTDRGLVDYHRRWNQALADIAAFYDWSPAAFAEKVSATHADLFFVRVDNSSTDGTIPFRQATSLLESIDRIVRTTAIVTHNPDRMNGAGRLASQVEEFLEGDVRMGHTKRGSFIITVAARLDETRTRSAGIDARAPETSSDIEAPVPTPPTLDQEEDFSRQVMTNLSKALDATSKASRKGDKALSFGKAIERGMRLSIVDALEEIGSAEGVKSIDLSFDWSSVLPQTRNVAERVVFTRSQIGRLPAIRERLVRQESPSEETIVGQVVELRRDEGSASGGEAVLRADVAGHFRKVLVPLSGVEYEWAIRAHQERMPFNVSGTLGKKGRSWALTGNVVPDLSFLKFTFGESPLV